MPLIAPMSKTIVIIGGGISGLATLHYLKQKYVGCRDVEILLLEKDASFGGTIRCVVRGHYLFEVGPNGFLDTATRTLELVRDLGLSAELVRRDPSSKMRYVALDDTLYSVPAGLAQFLTFQPFSWWDKARVFAEMFIPKGNDPDESVYDFGVRRFGKKFADIFLDPLVIGIYGGNARDIVLKAAFGKIYQLEQQHGSLLKAMMKWPRAWMSPRVGILTSFRRGQVQLTDGLADRYKESTRLNVQVDRVTRMPGYFAVTTADTRYEADEIFICAPAYQAALIVKEISPSLAQNLERIRYVPMAVVGLVFPCQALASRPSGFGYLIPSNEGKEILGVLFESNIFPGRCSENEVLLRVMIGGSRHPEILKKSSAELTTLACKEIQATLGVDTAPIETFYVAWSAAIPQYDRTYVEVECQLEEELRKWPGLHLIANYRKGVSINDCIENAYQAAHA